MSVRGGEVFSGRVKSVMGRLVGGGGAVSEEVS